MWRDGPTQNAKTIYRAVPSRPHHNFSRNVKARNYLHHLEGRLIILWRVIGSRAVLKMRLRHAMVCASNQNRSMEAHALLKKHGFDVSSYGTGAHVKLPGPSIREPNVYEFGTPYRRMFDDLKRKDPELYKRNGLLQMLKRNLNVKMAPQRWQENAADGSFDVVFTFEERVFDMVIEDLHNRDQVLMKSVLVINLDVKDNHEEAASGARLALDLCQKLEAVDAWEDDIDEIVIRFERQHRRKLIYTICFY